MSQDSKVLLVGFGNMGQALARGWLARGRAPDAILVMDPNPAARAAAAELGLTVLDRAEDARGVEIVLFAVKPQMLGEVLGSYAVVVERGALVLSIVAGKRIADYEGAFGSSAAIVRVMPNTPAAIGKGISVLVGNVRVSAAGRAACTELLEVVGRVEWLEDESLMDAVTAVSGSGPAYVFLLIECLAQAGEAAGLPRDLAERLATATVAGAGAYAEVAGEQAAELRRKVTSPGGTTAAALEVLAGENGFAALLEAAVAAATKRSKELSGH